MAFTPYPMPDVSSIVDLLAYPAVLIGDAWAVLMLLTFWVILTASVNTFERITRVEESMVASSFVVAIAAILLSGAQVVTPYAAAFPIIVTGIITSVLFIQRR
jgi:hypothetical protein